MSNLREPTSQEIDKACYHRHNNFGNMTEAQQALVRVEAVAWLKAWLSLADKIEGEN